MRQEKVLFFLRAGKKGNIQGERKHQIISESGICVSSSLLYLGQFKAQVDWAFRYRKEQNLYYFSEPEKVVGLTLDATPISEGSRGTLIWYLNNVSEGTLQIKK